MNLSGTYNTLTYRVAKGGKTIREVLLEDMMISTRLLRKVKRNTALTVNGYAISINAKSREGDVICLTMTEEVHRIYPENIPIEVVYEDSDLIVVNKVDNIVAHPTQGHPTHTLANAVRYYGLQQDEDFKPRLINRLDRDTSGIILFAKNPYAQHIVSEEMKQNNVQKTYTALVHGIVTKDSGTIDGPIDLLSEDSALRGVIETGKPSVTHYEVLARYRNSTLLKVVLETGRTHQIRVHLSHLGHPLVGDELYGSFERVAIKRQALHASEMTFKTPRSGVITVKAPLPEDIKYAIQVLS